MTTTNNLIDQVGGIEKAKVIVGGAPETSQFWRDMDSICSPNEILYYVEGPLFWIVWDVEKQKWVESIISEGSEYIIEQLQSLDELRTAIAQYDKAWVEKRFGIKKWYPIPEHHMCTDRRLDDTTDHITDIRNHISPRTVVWDLASGEDWSVNHG